MNERLKKGWPVLVLLLALIAMLPATGVAYISGDDAGGSGTSKTFNLTAMDGWISMGDGTQAYIWGYADQSSQVVVPNPNGGSTRIANPVCPTGGCVQYPGPTLIVNQGDSVTVNLKNAIPTLPGNTAVNTSILFPGQVVTASGGLVGLLTREAPPNNSTVVTYTFVASQPGTYTYFSGTQSPVQQEMGLFGTLIVRPNNIGSVNCVKPTNSAATNNGYAYCVKNGYYDHEYLFLASEMDLTFHNLIESGQMSLVDNTAWHSTVWFINGRTLPDTMMNDYVGWLPTQPYSALPQMHPLESVLMRMIGGGRALHPFHAHGQNHNVIARDGRLLQSTLPQTAPAYADMPISDYTTTTVAGETVDAIWGPWTGYKLGWDVFGPKGTHTCSTAAGPLTQLINFLGLNGAAWTPGFDARTGEWCGDHHPATGTDTKQIPVTLPDPYQLSFGLMYGGTPYLGIPGELPPIPDPHVGDFNSTQNEMAGISFMWHSHSEREITTNNIFIGGMATMSMVLPYTVAIP
jgi:manganese oxidase